MRTKIFLAVAGLVVAALVYFVVLRPAGPEAAVGAAGFGGRGGGFGDAPSVVTVEPVEQGTFSVRADFVGTLQGIAYAELYAKTNGPLTHLFVETGDRVRAGQVLARIDDAEARQEVYQAEAALKMTEATLAQRQAALRVVQMNAERTNALFEKKLVSEQEADRVQGELISAEAQVRVAAAQIEQARANLSQAQLRLENTRIVAPFGGVIGKRYLDLGASANANRPVFSIVDLSTIKTTVALVDKDVVHLQPGQGAVVTTDALPGEPFAGVIARISPIINPETGTTEAEIEIRNPGGVLRPGMLVRVSITRHTEPTALLVPQAALMESERGTHLFVAEPEEGERWAARQVPVRVLGASEGAHQGRVAVEGSLEAGDRVITLGQETLRDGASVRVSDPVRSSAVRADTTAQDRV